MAGRLELIAPGLLGPLPRDWGGSGGLRAARLERLLARAELEEAKAGGALASLFAAFAIATDPDRDLPSAPFARLAEAPSEADGGYWLHADPVHLRADRDRLRLFDSRVLDLSRDEAETLVAAFNGHFGDAGVRLIAARAERWYLRLDRPPALHTTPLETACGRPVDQSMPRGDDARQWAALLNEAQMLFHQHPVNDRREAAGRPRINGIWPWGGGALPEPPPAAPLAAVYARTPLASGLARWAGVSQVDDSGGALPALGGESDPGQELVFWDVPQTALRNGDAQAWRNAVRELDDWLAGPLASLGRGNLAVTILDPGRGTRYRLTPRSFRRLWRRRRPLDAYLASVD